MMNTCDNPDLSNYFDKNFAEYKKGFQSKGENYSYPPIWQVFNLLRPVRVSNTFNYVLGILKSSKSSKSSNMRFSHACMYTPANKFCNIDLISGEIWLGLETLHKLTSAGSYSLHILIKDFDQKTYVAVYDQFKVIMMLRWWYWW